MTSLDDIAGLEKLAFNAWPALRVAHVGDWLLRFSEGYTKRANSVNALAPARDTPAGEIEARVARAEALYVRHGQPCVFRVSPLMDPAVDALLAGRGWSRIDETVVMAAPLSDATMPAGVAVAEARDAVWSKGYMRFNGVPPARQAIHDRMLAAILSRAGYAIASDEEGAPVAFGLGVVEADHVGLFDIVADPSRRRAGHGLRVVNGILAWGRGHGATQAYLQVVATNAPAIALYERLGFVEAYRYHYRLPA